MPRLQREVPEPIALAVDFRGESIHSLSAMTISEACRFFDAVTLSGDSDERVGEPILREVRARLRALDQVGLGYISIDRSAATLSGGEAQRIRLASQVGAGLQGVTYILDEPSIGLHRGPKPALGALEALRDKGNTVLVEHDSETMLRADHLIEVGPERVATVDASPLKAPRPVRRERPPHRAVPPRRAKSPAVPSAVLETGMPSPSAARAPTTSRGSTSAFLWGRSPS